MFIGMCKWLCHTSYAIIARQYKQNNKIIRLSLALTVIRNMYPNNGQCCIF